MLGVVVYLMFLVLGFIMASSIFKEQAFYVRIWLGLLFGTLGLMWGVVPFAFVLGFTVISHILALVFFGGLTYLAFHRAQKALPEIEIPKKKPKEIDPETGEVIVVPEPTKLQKMIRKFLGFVDFKWDKTFAALIWVTVPLIILTGFILFSHVLDLKPDGYYAGQSTYGDLPLHLGITSSIAEQGMFPPDYSISPGTKLSYPFLVDSLSSSLMVFGSSLSLAVLFPSLLLLLAMIMGFFILAYEFLKNKGASIMATVLFFINGGFGFFYFLEANYVTVDSAGKLGVASGNMMQNLTRMVTEFYHTPTNFNQFNIRWSNIICDMIIPQRTTLAGWTFVILAFWLLFKALNTQEKKFYVAAGITGGLLPMINTHAFLGFGIIALVWAAVFLFQQKKIWDYIKNWLWLGIPLLLIALPQLFFWTFTQTSGEGFLKITWTWPTIGQENFIWFWVKNVGIVFVLMLPALFASRKKMLSFMAGPVVLFIVANIVKFQPNDYDNNKLFYIWYLFMVILVCSYVWSIYIRMKGMQMRWMLIAVVVAFGTISGGFTIAREINSGGTLQQFNNATIKAADFVQANTPKRAMFLTGQQHLNPVAALAGRNIVLGTGLYLFFHGVNTDERKADIPKMYAGGGEFEQLSQKYKVDYVYISSYERNDFKANEQYFKDNYPKVFENGDIVLFAISDAAKSFSVNGK
ncbi:MAG: hypothetical protein WCL54_01830 [Clostridia bacterium]